MPVTLLKSEEKVPEHGVCIRYDRLFGKYFVYLNNVAVATAENLDDAFSLANDEAISPAPLDVEALAKSHAQLIGQCGKLQIEVQDLRRENSHVQLRNVALAQENLKLAGELEGLRNTTPDVFRKQIAKQALTINRLRSRLRTIFLALNGNNAGDND